MKQETTYSMRANYDNGTSSTSTGFASRSDAGRAAERILGVTKRDPGRSAAVCVSIEITPE